VSSRRGPGHRRSAGSSYGAILATGSAAPEFANGGHPGWDASHSEGGKVGYDLTVSPVVVNDPETAVPTQRRELGPAPVTGAGPIRAGERDGTTAIRSVA